MQVPQLPFESPGIYKRLKGRLVASLLPGLEKVVVPALRALPPLLASGSEQAPYFKRQRTLGLAKVLEQSKFEIASEALLFASQRWSPKPVSASQNEPEADDADLPGDELVSEAGTVSRSQASHNLEMAEEDWELFQWLLRGLLSRDFPDKNVSLEDREGIPFYLYRLAQQLAGSHEWRGANANNCLQQVLFELSAEHTRERLQVSFGMGGQSSVNHITKVLRPVDRHQNGALHVLKDREIRPKPAQLVVDRPLDLEEMAIRRALKEWQIPVPWLMNWTEHFTEIRRLLAGSTGLPDEVSDEALGSVLSKCKDVYLKSEEATKDKLARALKQLAELHKTGQSMSTHVDLVALLERLDLVSTEDSTCGEDSEIDFDLEDETNELEALVGRMSALLESIEEPLVRVAVLIRKLKELHLDQERDSICQQLLAHWGTPGALGMPDGLFAKYGLPATLNGLSEKRLAMAAGLPLKTFVAKVEAGLRLFDAPPALPPFVEVAVALRRLKLEPQPSKRAKLEQKLLQAWKRPGAFDGGLFGYLGLNANPPDIGELTEELLAWASDLPLAVFEQQVTTAMAGLNQQP